ncbi:MAG: Carbamoyl-phosphate synthase small chain [Alphaproteobacteria bacterium ADurb.Bin438]|nr:MAG: Carbamoyl-phosphate synthase small chain [Alphaproteobacteria bacterium ADurb.Bin438]
MYDFLKKRQKKAFLALASGEVFKGYSIGAEVDNVGEAIFNTGMSGYEEVVSDPSYAGQFVTFTAPEIGNYGTNDYDMESSKLYLNGVILHELNQASNFRSTMSFENLLKKYNVPAIAGIDTRRLTLVLRQYGVQKAFLHCSNEEISVETAIKKAKDWEGLDGQDYALKVTTDKTYKWNNKGRFKVVAVDYGIKHGILKRLEENGMDVTVVTAKTSAKDILAMKPDGVFLSNGPADPIALDYAINGIKEMVGKVPIMGICLGHQLIGLALGAECGRLKFGHHGCNHPVKNLITGKVEITSQNHNFALDINSLPSHVELTHVNLNDNTVEGIMHKNEPIFSVQYHPESCPGPHDSRYLFEQFVKIMER